MTSPWLESYFDYSADVDACFTASDPSAVVQTCSVKELELGCCCVFDPHGHLIDEQVPEYQDAVDLVFSEKSPDAPWDLDGLVDTFANQYGVEEMTKLLYLFGQHGGGMGYRLEKASHWFHAWDVDHERKVIAIDENEVFSSRTNAEAARTLKEVMYREFEGQESFWDVAWRFTKGAGITVLGVGEVAVGIVGIIIPEPGTTAAGIAVTAFGVATTIEGITQMLNVNEGRGYNPIEEGFLAVGNWAGGEDGESLAQIAFVVTNIVVSLGGSYKILKVKPPNKNFIFKGTYTGAGFKNFYPQGFSIGRLQLNYPFSYTTKAGENISGRVLINVTNNSNQWVFRFETVGQKLVMNGRKIGIENWHRKGSPLEMLKILAKLALHGAKKGWP